MDAGTWLLSTNERICGTYVTRRWYYTECTTGAFGTRKSTILVTSADGVTTAHGSETSAAVAALTLTEVKGSFARRAPARAGARVEDLPLRDLRRRAALDAGLCTRTADLPRIASGNALAAAELLTDRAFALAASRVEHLTGGRVADVGDACVVAQHRTARTLTLAGG